MNPPPNDPQFDGHTSSSSDGSRSTADEREFRDLLRSHGLRSTAQRIAVLNLLAATAEPGTTSKHRTHLTAPDIQERLEQRGNHIDLGTIYRIVNKLANLGVLHAIAHVDQPSSYGLSAHGHHHAICNLCGAVSQLPTDSLGPLLEITAQLTDFLPEDQTLTIHGLCVDCRGTA